MPSRALLLIGASLLPLCAAAPLACSGKESPSEPGFSGSGGASGMTGAGGQEQGGVPTESGGGGAGAGGPAGEAGAAGAAGASGSDGNGGVCSAVETAETVAAGAHVAECSLVEYTTNPPSSGSHYPVWADFGVYDFPLPRGFWMHNLEHGAVVVTYNCPDECAQDLAAATSWAQTLKPDAVCPSSATRIILVPDPKLDVRWAASSWGFTLRANCFDAETFSKFFYDHAGQADAPEFALCGAGVNFRLDGVETCGAK
jgi:hypothetical protein